jgi:ribonuclease HI
MIIGGSSVDFETKR